MIISENAKLVIYKKTNVIFNYYMMDNYFHKFVEEKQGFEQA